MKSMSVYDDSEEQERRGAFRSTLDTKEVSHDHLPTSRGYFPHENLPGYDERNVLHDGCDECEHRSRLGLDGILAIDHGGRLALWQAMRACDWSTGDGLDYTPSACDRRLMKVLYLVAVFMENCAIQPHEVEKRMTAEHDRLRAALGF